MNRPTKATTAGQAFLALRSKALSAGRTTAEYLRLYALEGFLLRIRLVARLATAREPFHVDVNVGDPIWPAPAEVALPRLLEAAPIRLWGYPREMVLAEKIVTAIQRGQANTRWRDFGDIYQLTRRYAFRASDIGRALQTVAEFRDVELSALGEMLDGYAEIGQPRWAPWRAKLQLTEILPADFGAALEVLRAFADPILTGVAADSATWNPELEVWEHADSDR